MLLASFDYGVERVAVAMIGVFMGGYCAITNIHALLVQHLPVRQPIYPTLRSFDRLRIRANGDEGLGAKGI